MKIKPIHIILAALVLFTAIEARGLFHYDNVDENVYFYMGKLVSEGKMPYSDFFFAHPPLEIFVNAAIFKLFGFNLFLLKLVQLVSTLVSAFLVYKIAKKLGIGSAGEIFAPLLFLFSYRVMAEATYALGINLTTLFVVAGACFLLKKKHLAGGLFLGLAAITGIYSAVPIFAIGLFMLLRDRKGFVKMALGFLAVFLSVNLLFILLAGGATLTLFTSITC